MNELLEEVARVSDLPEEDYIILRKNSFGASDAAALIGVSPFISKEDMIKLKKIKEVTPEEVEIGKKPSVRKGKDLEPLILDKYRAETHRGVYKPEYMYRIKAYPFLTVNYDAIVKTTEEPVEVKYVTIYGHKYFSLDTELVTEIKRYSKNIHEHIEKAAAKIGIPIYYYTQIQQQLLGTPADLGFLVCLFEKTWELKIYQVPQDLYTQAYIIKCGEENYEYL